jgi:hypothetical protein
LRGASWTGWFRPVYRLRPKPRKSARRLLQDKRVGRRCQRSGSAWRHVIEKNFVGLRNAAMVYHCVIAKSEDSMITRRTLVLTALILATAAPLARAEPAASDDPAAIVSAIYTRAAKGKGDGGGGFVIENKAAKARYLSKSLIALWTKADAHTQKGDVGPVDFDPVSNSQDPDIKSFKVETEKLDTDKALIAVTIDGHRGAREKAADQTLRYAFLREATGWKIDDIRSAADGTPWSLRDMLTDSLKN